jgi:hypothetical protein
MAQFRNDLGYEVEVPSLALVVASGEVIDADDTFNAVGFTLVTTTSKKSASVDTPAEPIVAQGDATTTTSTNGA